LLAKLDREVSKVREAGREPSAVSRPAGAQRWWVEIIMVLGLYWLYSAARNQFGSSSVKPSEALENAERVIDIEQAMSLFFEEDLQSLFLDQEWFLWFSNIFYGTFHFGVTIGALVWLFWRFPAHYRPWRTSLVYTTIFGLVGFSLLPLMPPRLLAGCKPDQPFGGCADYGFVDTLAEFGGLWSFDSGRMAEISNQYAAMPSLHIAWSVWCLAALWPVLRSQKAKVAIALYPFATLFVIVITANHFWLDAVGGLIALAAGIIAGHISIRISDDLRARYAKPDRREIDEHVR
jgi:hypothetical protein